MGKNVTRASKARQVLRFGVVDGDNEADILWEPNTGKLALRYWNDKRGTEFTVSRRYDKLTAPRLAEIVRNMDRLVEAGMDGNLIGLLKEMTGKMRSLLPAPKEDK